MTKDSNIYLLEWDIVCDDVLIYYTDRATLRKWQTQLSWIPRELWTFNTGGWHIKHLCPCGETITCVGVDVNDSGVLTPKLEICEESEEHLSKCPVFKEKGFNPAFVDPDYVRKLEEDKDTFREVVLFLREGEEREG